MATRNEIRAWVRSQAMVESDDLADSYLNASLNEAINQVSVRFNWPYLGKSAKISYLEDFQSYNLPTDFAKLSRVINTDTGTSLEEVSPNRMWDRYGDDFPTASYPTSFFLWGSQIYFAPIPDATHGSATLYYYRTPTLIDNDEEWPEFASQFHMILAEYMLQKVWEREEDFVKAKDHEDAFNEGIERMARYYLNRSSDHPMIVGDGQNIPLRLHPNMPWFEA